MQAQERKSVGNILSQLHSLSCKLHELKEAIIFLYFSVDVISYELSLGYRVSHRML